MKRKLFVSWDIGRLHIGFGWYWGENFALLGLDVLEYTGLYLCIIDVQIIKFGLSVGWDR